MEHAKPLDVMIGLDNDFISTHNCDVLGLQRCRATGSASANTTPKIWRHIILAPLYGLREEEHMISKVS